MRIFRSTTALSPGAGVELCPRCVTSLLRYTPRRCATFHRWRCPISTALQAFIADCSSFTGSSNDYRMMSSYQRSVQLDQRHEELNNHDCLFSKWDEIDPLQIKWHTNMVTLQPNPPPRTSVGLLCFPKRLFTSMCFLGPTHGLLQHNVSKDHLSHLSKMLIHVQ